MFQFLICALLLTFSSELATSDQPQPNQPASSTAESASQPAPNSSPTQNATQPALPGDYNHDGKVDNKDLQQWQDDFSSTSNSDADQDGDSDGHDFLSWQRFFGSGDPNSIPEPSTISLLLIPTLYHIGFRRSR